MNPYSPSTIANPYFRKMSRSPLPQNEINRILSLSEFDLDYSDLYEHFRDLSKLAAKVAGTEISLVNLIDSFTQWTISDYGLDIKQLSREDSICQYTINAKESFEVKDLSADERFKDKIYVTQAPKIRYYFGVPLVTADGYNLGALCVMDKLGKEISPEKVELLQIIAQEIVTRLQSIKLVTDLRHKLKEAQESQRKVAHDIRGPLSGIIGLSQVINEMNGATKLEDIQELIALIHKGGKSILELADEILGAEKKKATAGQFTLDEFREMLDKLYAPQAVNKQISFTIHVDPLSKTIPVSRNKLLQVTGNLISNAIKFTPVQGKVSAYLGLVPINAGYDLHIIVTDSGAGIDPQKADEIISGSATSTDGTGGEQGYGFGLALVKHLVEKLHGKFFLNSTPGKGSVFTVIIPQDHHPIP